MAQLLSKEAADKIRARVAEDNPIRAYVGMRFMEQVASVLRHQGDTTAKQLSGLVDLTPALDAMVGYGYLEMVHRHYRLTEKGRNDL